MPSVSVVLPSHLKPEIMDAVACLRAQSHEDWTCVIYDAGHWRTDPDSPMRSIYEYISTLDPRIEWIITNDPFDFAEHYCPCSYRFNQAQREGKLTGDYCFMLPDDDVIAPTYMERMLEELSKGHDAVYCAQNRVKVDRQGTETQQDVLWANAPLTGDVIGRVDLLQVMFATSLLAKLTPPYMPEEPSDNICRVQDGIFFNRLLTVTDAIYPVPDILCTHRFMPHSTYSPA